MFHDCGNEGNGGYLWDAVSKTMMPEPTGCDGSILTSPEQIGIPSNGGRIIKTAEGACF
jgi:hypothetical protein